MIKKVLSTKVLMLKSILKHSLGHKILIYTDEKNSDQELLQSKGSSDGDYF